MHLEIGQVTCLKAVIKLTKIHTYKNPLLKDPPWFCIVYNYFPFLSDFDFSFIQNPRNHTAVVGDAISIKCVPPTSFPVQVAIHWYHNYQVITQGAGISIDSSGTIKFTSIKKSDEGMYFCDGTNSHLQATRTSLPAYVTVHGR